MFIFDDDIPQFYCFGGKPLSKWWMYRYDWSKADFNDTIWLSKEICSIVISYLVDRSINLEDDIVAMDKKEIKFVNKLIKKKSIHLTRINYSHTVFEVLLLGSS